MLAVSAPRGDGAADVGIGGGLRKDEQMSNRRTAWQRAQVLMSGQ